MPDVFSEEERSRIMAAVGHRDTKPEISLRRALWATGVRGWRCNRRDLPGSPDVSFGPTRVAVFVDGAFWHGHPSKYVPGQSGEFWDRKIQANMERDARVTRELEARGWFVLRFWDFQIAADPESIARTIAKSVVNRSQYKNAHPERPT